MIVNVANGKPGNHPLTGIMRWNPALADLLAAAETVLAATGNGVALCPAYGQGR